ncbi:hypothetical protein GCM10008957_46700 [Deinococcus ruber]|uniref:Uncharacterized protein n=1 Tax=Deinococcus ruber TaxID=1848197 RepID=A0A918FCI3_9DEIO|nr:hypothetical protein GCM10008957_46700 [Deinococcus ruber]
MLLHGADVLDALQDRDLWAGLFEVQVREQGIQHWRMVGDQGGEGLEGEGAAEIAGAVVGLFGALLADGGRERERHGAGPLGTVKLALEVGGKIDVRHGATVAVVGVTNCRVVKHLARRC